MSTRFHEFCLLYSLKDGLEVFPPKILGWMIMAKIERLSFLFTYRRMIRNFLENLNAQSFSNPTMVEATQGMEGGVNFGNREPPTEEEIQGSEW